MKRLSITITLLTFFIFIPLSVDAAEKIEIYLKSNNAAEYVVDLAHPEKGKVKLPLGSADIRAVAQAGHFVIGVTRPEYPNRSPLIFRFDLTKEVITDFQTFSAVQEKETVPAYALAAVGDSTVYAGTFGSEGTTGNLLKIHSAGKSLKVEKMGQVADKQGIFTLLPALTGDKLYGILFPSNAFFVYDIKSRQAVLFHETEPDTTEAPQIEGLHQNKEAHLCKALGCDKTGKIYGTAGFGRLFCYDPQANKIEKLAVSLPYVQYLIMINRVESWALSDDGKLYGGTSVDGFLFSFDPTTKRLVNLGKPIMAGNIKSLVFQGNKIHGLAGAGNEYTHYFTYDPVQGGFEDLGLLRFNNPLIGARQMTYTACQILPLKDGRFLFAEDDLLPSLIFYRP